MKLIKYTAVALLALSSVTASAGLLKIDGGSNVTIPTNNNFGALVGATQYNFGGNVKATETSELMLTFSFLAEEADATNTFTSEGGTINNSTLTSPFSYTKSYAAGDLINFGFKTNLFGPMFNSILNGSNVIGDGIVSFAVALNTTYNGVAYDAILFFDDAGGTNDDDNHDDLLIGVKAVNVPESSSFILMLFGLAGLVAARRLKV